MLTSLRPRLTRPVRRVGSVVSLILLLSSLAAAPAAADEPGKYYDGGLKYSSVVNCPSIIWGSPYTEYGAGAYAGYFADPDSGVPAVGSPVYMHFVMYGMGNPCSGGTFFWPSIDLPAGVSFAPGAGTPRCFYDGQEAIGPQCPGWSSVEGQGASTTGSGPNGSVRYVQHPGDFGNTWGVAQGHYWEFLIPIVASQTMSGSNLKVYLETADGNDNPTLAPTAPVYVFGTGVGGGTTPAVMYDNPSTYTSAVLPGTSTPSKFGIISEFMAVSGNQAGTAFMEIGTASGSYAGRVNLAIPSGFQSFRMWGDWDEPTIDPLIPGKKYFWRGGWDPGAPGGGDVVRGVERTFVAPAAKTCLARPVTVNLSLGELPTSGDDVVLGTSGDDDINGQDGSDAICGLGGNDRIDPGAGNDLVDAGGGNDAVMAVVGDDALKGGSGVDTVSYAGSAAAITLSLAIAVEQITGAGLDVVVGFENAVGGSAGDKLTGNAGANKLYGINGADKVSGAAGNDVLVGGKGSDTCSGGSGKDTATTCEVKSSIP